MNINKLLRAYKRKLILEDILKSGLYGLITGSSGVFITSLVFHIMLRETPLKLTLLTGGAVFILIFIVSFVVHFPNRKRVAKRMDEMGLKERVSTMLVYEHEEGELIKLQRKDAVTSIEGISPRDMKFRFSKHELIVCGAALIAAIVMLLLPYQLFAFGNTAAIVNAEQQQRIRDVIEKLRNKVKNADMDDSVRDSLNEVIDKLEEDLKDTDSELEQAALIDQAKQKIQQILNQEGMEDTLEEILDAFNDAKNEVLGIEGEEEEEPPESEMPEGEMPEGEMPEGEMPEGEMPEGEMPEGEMPEGEMPEGGMPQGDMPEGEGAGGSTMTEEIYDPISGDVSYGKVFAAYYAEYLAALEAGEVPSDLQEIIDRYYSSLSE